MKWVQVFKDSVVFMALSRTALHACTGVVCLKVVHDRHAFLWWSAHHATMLKGWLFVVIIIISFTSFSKKSKVLNCIIFVHIQ